MRLAFVDLVFSWPPNGGADVDLFHVVSHLQARGHEVHVFVASDPGSWERGNLDPSGMPFPVSRLEFGARTLHGPTLARRFRAAVDAYAPDVVLVTNGFFMKPFVIDALAHHPLIGRYYLYEAACIRDSLLFKDGQPCPNDFLHTPDLCRRCALAGLKPSILRWRHLTWSHEFLASGAFLPGFHRRHVEALRKLQAVIVTNDIMARHFEGFVGRTFIVPGGVELADYAAALPERRDRMVILMTGRAEEPSKGLDVLLEAGRRLAARRRDFEIWATHPDRSLNNAWFKAVGWHPHDAVVRMYAQASVCVTPSILEEPFGLVAVEAMASARPVCASRVGGLKEIVRHGETGLLFDRGDAEALAGHLDRLLDDETLRRSMGEAGRRRAEQEFDWARIAEKHYEPILEAVRP